MADSAAVAHRVPGMVLTDHRFPVPLDHDRPDGEQIEVFAREITAPGPDARSRPWLVYLQGGPGYGGPRPLSPEGWVGRVIRDYRLLLLDQRGTGLSTPADRQSLPARGNARQQADYLAHFRADSIVRDAELIRLRLTGGDPWTVLGQSFGGFCAVTYLSFAPEGLREVLITGGLPGLDADADAVYLASYPRMERKSIAHYTRFPEDVTTARRIAAHLRENETVLPNGTLLSVEAFQDLGILLGRGTGSVDLHYVLESAFAGNGRLSDSFQERVQSVLSYAGHPLYALLHEAAYAQGEHPTAWAAERIRHGLPHFDVDKTLAASDQPLLFTSETINPGLFRSDPALRPLRETAEALADRTGWPALYDPDVLAANTVPAAAVVYHDDLYIDTAHSLRTASAIRGLRTWVTNEYEHDGIGASGSRVIDRLLDLVRGER